MSEFKKPISVPAMKTNNGKPTKEKLSASKREELVICLGMIVNNESKILNRMFESVKPFIDYWVIIDTGSKDNTKEILETFKKDIPGEIHESPFVNFEHNRNEVLKLCKGKCDYVLLLDADMVLLPKSGLTKEQLKAQLTEPGYYLHQHNPVLDWWNWRIIDIKNYVWEYIGVTHEVLVPLVVPTSPKQWKNVMMNILSIDDKGDGGCKADKLPRDIRLLTAALAKEQRVAVKMHYLFYLGQTYYFLSGEPGTTPEDSKDLKYKAIMTFQDAIRFSRGQRGTDQEELWATHLYLAQVMNNHGGYAFHKVLEVYTACHNLRPFRMESNHEMMFICNRNELWHHAFLWARLALEPFDPNSDKLTLTLVSPRDDKLLLRHDYRLISFWDELLQCSFNLNEIYVAIACCVHLVNNKFWEKLLFVNEESKARMYKNIETVLKAKWLATSGKKLEECPSNLVSITFPSLYKAFHSNQTEEDVLPPSTVEEVITPSVRKTKTPSLADIEQKLNEMKVHK